MDEPMEESPQGDTQAEVKIEEKKAKATSILRHGNLAMMTITVQDYENEYWPKLENAINQLLTMTPRDYIPISYEQMYSCVYKCVCKQFSEKLYNDLVRQITDHLERLCLQLKVHINDSRTYIENFNIALHQYLQALGGIVPIFAYMNRFYIESKLKTDLNAELRKLFVLHVADKHISNLLPLLVEANSTPFSIQPQTMANILKNIYSLKPEFASLRPHLFAKYIPNILPPCSEGNLDQYREEARQMQRDLQSHPDFIAGDRSRKRAGDEEPPKMTPLNLIKGQGFNS